MYRLRGHPSLIAWMNGSDNPPPPDVEQTYLKVEKEMLLDEPHDLVGHRENLRGFPARAV